MIQKIKLLILSSIFVSPWIMANTSANIKITGDIKQPTCLVNGNKQSDVIFELADISPKDLNQTSYISLKSNVSKNVTVSCDAETYLTYRAVDTYMNTPWPAFVSPDYFNMVLSDNSNKSVGLVLFSTSDVTIDSKSAFIARDGVTANNTVVRKNILNGWATKDSTVFANRLTAGKIFSANFTAAGGYLSSINQFNTDGIDLSSKVNYQAEVVLAFNFGILIF
ncbi:fimbrial protein [Providencia rustigianii]|uniref:fimbrial protein n=1 Tax=Providencia rustigianii TaxID=158850 RepID=UPI000D83A338|nr:P pilus assembly protein, pilin FimA [Providencia rustigianii]